jgi:hypothetical protein
VPGGTEVTEDRRKEFVDGFLPAPESKRRIRIQYRRGIEATHPRIEATAGNDQTVVTTTSRTGWPFRSLLRNVPQFAVIGQRWIAPLPVCLPQCQENFTSIQPTRPTGQRRMSAHCYGSRRAVTQSPAPPPIFLLMCLHIDALSSGLRQTVFL